MLIVDDNTKYAYQSDSMHKDLRIYLPDIDLTLDNTHYNQNSMKLQESILNSDSIEFVGCIASSFSIKCNNVPDNLKGQRIEVYITSNNTQEIPLFKGIIDSAKKEGNKDTKVLQAFDALYALSEMDVTDWYNNHVLTTIGELRKEFLDSVGLEYDDIILTNDWAPALCGTERTVASLSGLDFMKNVCQINGCFGKIDRNGKFKWVYLNNSITSQGVYPSLSLYPSSTLYISIPATADSTLFSYYKKLEFDDYNVQPIDTVVLRDSADSVITAYGSGENHNKYIIQSNLFVYNQDSSVLETMAHNIYTLVAGISYTPFTSNNNGLPFLECGDMVSYYDNIYSNTREMESVEKNFYVFNRILSGIQSLRDNYVAEGNEFQSEFITDLNTQMNTVEQNQTNINYAVSKLMNEQLRYEFVAAFDPSIHNDPYTFYCVAAGSSTT